MLKDEIKQSLSYRISRELLGTRREAHRNEFLTRGYYGSINRADFNQTFDEACKELLGGMHQFRNPKSNHEAK